MIHRVRTAFGDSDKHYGGDDLEPGENFLQGMVQGNAAGPSMWTILSSIIFEVLHSRGHSTFFCSAISRQVFCLLGFMYVDDCDLFQVGEDPAVVLTSMQSVINSWGSIVKVLGGAMDASAKTWWYLVDFVWKKGKWTTTDPLFDSDLTAPDKLGNTVSLKRLCHHESAEMLGIWMAPNGDQGKQVKVLRRKALEWGAKVRAGHPSPLEAWTALHTNISSRLKYCLAASTFSEKQCKSIMFPAIKAALPKAGICGSMATGMRNGPKLSGGAGVLSLFDNQGCARTAALEHLFRKSPTGEQMRLCIEDICQEIGLYGSIWSLPFGRYSKWIAQDSWIYSVLEYNHKNEITISIKHSCISPQRQYDRSIMEIASQLYDDSPSLKAINRVRMLHQVHDLSSICTADGKSLSRQYFQSKQVHAVRNRHLWPTKHHVRPADYTIWRKFLKKVFTINPVKLPFPLGKWLEVPDHTHQWDWFVSPCSTFLYHHAEGQWFRHVKQEHSHRDYHIPHLLLSHKPP